MITFEELQNMNYGDQIIIQDPFLQERVPYVFISKDEVGSLHFISSFGASFIIKDQETINGFGVELITNEHELWKEDLSKYGQKLGSIIGNFETGM